MFTFWSAFSAFGNTAIRYLASFSVGTIVGYQPRTPTRHRHVADEPCVDSRFWDKMWVTDSDTVLMWLLSTWTTAMSNLTLSLIVISTFILKIVAHKIPAFQRERTLGVGYCIFADALAHCPCKRVMFQASRQRLVLLYLASLLISNSYSPEPNLAVPTMTAPSSGWQPPVPLPVQPLIMDLRDLRPSCQLGIDWRGRQPLCTVVPWALSEYRHNLLPWAWSRCW